LAEENLCRQIVWSVRTASRSWTLREDNHAHHHGVVQLSDSPLVLELSFRASKDESPRRVGVFELDLHGLLEGGYVRRENSGTDAVRLRIARKSDGSFVVQVKASGPCLPLA